MTKKALALMDGKKIEHAKSGRTIEQQPAKAIGVAFKGRKMPWLYMVALPLWIYKVFEYN